MSNTITCKRSLERALLIIELLDDPSIGDGTKDKLLAELNMAIDRAQYAIPSVVPA